MARASRKYYLVRWCYALFLTVDSFPIYQGCVEADPFSPLEPVSITRLWFIVLLSLLLVFGGTTALR
jgi:hypothetical protein